VTYVDDMLIVGSQERVDHTRKALMARFKFHDLGEAKFFLGMTIKRDRVGKPVWLGQQKFAKGILERCSFEGTRPRRTPMDANLKLSTNGEDAARSNTDQYPEMIGCLLYLSALHVVVLDQTLHMQWVHSQGSPLHQKRRSMWRH
jgi:hypothetical protein